MNRPRSAAELSRRQLLRVLGGLVGATLGIRAVSEHAGAKPTTKRPKEELAAARYDYVHHDQIFQPYELPLGSFKQRSERVKAGR